MAFGRGAIFSAVRIPTAVFELDAGNSSSYSGSGQTWANIVTSPADGSAQTDYDFYRGITGSSQSSDPTFNGSAGANTSAEYWSFDGGDFFNKITTNGTFINSLHKDSAVFTWYGFLKTPTSLSGGNCHLFGTNGGGTSGKGLSLYLQSGGTMTLLVSDNSGGAALNKSTSSSFFSDATNHFLAVSYNEATGVGMFYRNGPGGKSTAAISGTYTSPSSASADYDLQLFAAGNSAGISPTGARLWRTGMFNVSLSELQLDALYNRYSTKLA